MYFIIYHVSPTEDLMDKNKYGGAYVSCWIEATTMEKAILVAEAEILEANWQILEQEEAYVVTEKDYLPDSPGFKFYDQALIDKAVLCFNTYSKS